VTKTLGANQEAYDLDRQYVFHSWSAQGALSPLVVSHASGCDVFDHEGRRYLDFSSQLVNTNIGHSHPAVVKAIQEQAAKLATIAPQHAVLERGVAARKILEKAGPAFSKVFFTNGGADAVENAVRAARLFTGKDKVLSTYRSYHGNTGAAIGATGDWRRMPNEYAIGHRHFFGPFLYRSEFWSTSEEQETERALHHLERVIQAEGPQTIAAILLESVPGTAGIMVPPPGYLQGVRDLCTKYGIVYIADEVMAGFGRTGYWFAHQAFGVTPDLITFAKGVNSGYVPVGGVIFTPDIAAHFDNTVFPGGLTYSGHPLAMASIIAALDAMENEGIVENARLIGDTVLGPGLRALQDKYPVIGEVRGLGVFFALDLVKDRTTKEPVDAAYIGKLKSTLLEHGLLGFAAENRLHVVPPLIVTDEQVAEGLEILDRVFASMSS
jgi:taurine---2-oxoglutarate transaminase